MDKNSLKLFKQLTKQFPAPWEIKRETDFNHISAIEDSVGCLLFEELEIDGNHPPFINVDQEFWVSLVEFVNKTHREINR